MSKYILNIKAKMVELHLACLKEINKADKKELVELIYNQFSEESAEQLLDVYKTEAEMMRLLIDITIGEMEQYLALREDLFNRNDQS